MTNLFADIASPDHSSLSELNVRHARAKARLAAARLSDDHAPQAAASAELVKLDEAIATILATLALRNASIARQRRAAA